MKHSPTKKDFNPSDLDSKNVETEVLENFSKDVVEIWNANLIRKSRALMATAKVDTENFVWITEADPENNNRFKLDNY